MTNELDMLEVKNGLDNMAELCKTFYEALRNRGFPPHEAIILTSTWMTTTISTGARNSDD